MNSGGNRNPAPKASPLVHDLGAHGCGMSAVAAIAPRNLIEKPFVELAIATICTDGFANQGHRPAFALLPRTGVRNVEFNVWYPDTITPEYFADLKERSVAAGLKPVSVQGGAFGGNVAQDVLHKTALLHGARALGCHRIKCTGARRGTGGGLTNVIATCLELAPIAEEMGLLITLENHAGNVLENIADFEEIFARIDSPNVGLCLDTGHFEGVGINLMEVIDKFSTRLLHVDLKDCKERGKGHDTVVFGEGVTDFHAFLNYLLSVKNYAGYLVIEMAWINPKEPVLSNLQKAAALFKGWERPIK